MNQPSDFKHRPTSAENTESDLESVKEPDTDWTDVKRNSMTPTGQEVSRDATGKRLNVLLL